MRDVLCSAAMGEMRSLLTGEVMQPILALMNTDLGFRTDRDAKVQPKDKDGNAMTPYAMEIVRDCEHAM